MTDVKNIKEKYVENSPERTQKVAKNDSQVSFVNV